MKPDFSLTLTSSGTVFVFERYEIPESITFGGEQALAVHNLVGGTRVVDAMGKVDMPLAWEGIFYGQNALARARYLDGLRTNGRPLDLAWSFLAYQVVIRRFEARMERQYQIPYRIEMEPVTNRTRPVKEIADAGIDGWIRDDMATASALGLQIGDGPLSSALGTLDGAIKGVSDFAKATTATIRTVLGPLAAVQARLKILIGSASNTVANVSTLGGIVPGNPVSQSLGSVTSRVAAATQLPQLYGLQSVTNRMGANLTGATGSGSTVVQAGGDLYRTAAQKLGSAAEWAAIANANGMSDPQVNGIQSLKIPSAASTGGVLQK